MVAEMKPLLSTAYYCQQNQSESRALVRAGTTGACAPTEIWKRVLGTRPDKGATLLNNKKCSKNRQLTKDKSSFKDAQYNIWGKYCKKQGFFRE